MWELLDSQSVEKEFAGPTLRVQNLHHTDLCKESKYSCYQRTYYVMQYGIMKIALKSLEQGIISMFMPSLVNYLLCTYPYHETTFSFTPLLQVLVVQVHGTGGFAAANIGTLVGRKPRVYIAVFTVFHCSHCTTHCATCIYIKTKDIEPGCDI